MRVKKDLLLKIRQIINSSIFNYFLILLLIVSVYFLWSHKDVLPTSSRYGYIGIFTSNLLASSTVVIPLPGVVAVFLGGGLWNPVFVGIAAGLGATLGEIIGYLAGYGGKKIIKSLDKKSWLAHLSKFFQKNGFITILITSFIPFPFFDIIGIISGALSYSLWKFILATLVGRIFRDIIIAWSGAQILPY